MSATKEQIDRWEAGEGPKLSEVLEHGEWQIDQMEDQANRVPELEEQIKSLEELRPVWAQGFTNDSMAAQANANAISDVWALLGATNQTEAMEKLRKLLEKEPTDG
jgi:hypothetical protein